MLLKALKSNSTYGFLLVPFIAIALWIKSFMQAASYPFYPGEDAMLLYQPVNALLGKSPMAGHIVALIFIIVLSFLVLRLKLQYSFIRERTILPSFIFILITSGMHELHAIHPVYFAALFLILTIDRIFNSYEKEVIHANAFESGILLAIGSLFYFNLVFFFPFLWIGFIILKPKVNWREFILTLLGFAFPWIGAAAYYGATGQIAELQSTIQSNFQSHNFFLKDNLPMQIYMGYLALLILLASILILSQYDAKKISTRKYFKAFFWVFLISAVLMFAVPAASQEIILLMAIPLSFLISNYLIFLKRPIFGEIFLFLLVAAVIALQFIK
jgi:hypothetical protein